MLKGSLLTDARNSRRMRMLLSAPIRVRIERAVQHDEANFSPNIKEHGEGSTPEKLWFDQRQMLSSISFHQPQKIA